MDFWAEQQGHLPQYNKFNTIPSRSCAQNVYRLPNRHQTAQYPVYYGEQRDKPIDSGYWPARDVPSRTNLEITAPTSPSYFPFNIDRPVQQHYLDVGEHQHREARDWTTYQQRERGMQQEGWSYAPVHYKRDISKKNESNFRELEAWALRYSHSLPRRRRIEAELRGTMQDTVVERREMQTQNLQESMLWNKASCQQAQNYYLGPPTSHNMDIKDKISYQTKLYSQPPNYNAPPPYNVQYKNVPMLQQWEKQNHEVWQVRKKQGREMGEETVSQVRTKESHALQGNSPPQLVQVKPSSEASKIIEGRKFKLNKKAGGMTIFCLVSRIADTDRETLPISKKQSEVEHKKTSNVSQPLELADEVDFKTPVQTSTKATRSPYMKLQAIPICKNLTDSLFKMAAKDLPKTNDVSASGKLAVKYPLWRRPSFTCSAEIDSSSSACSKDTAQETSLKCSGNDDKEGKKIWNKTKDSGAMLMIDTTCVVVKMEVLKAPRKEQVHYLDKNELSENGRNLDGEGVQYKHKRQEDIGKVEELEKLEADKEEMEYDVEKAKSEILLPTNSELVPEESEEHVKSIVERESTTTPLHNEQIGDLGVEDSPVQNSDINELRGEVDRKGSQNESTTSKSDNWQPLQVRSREDETKEIEVLKGDSIKIIENLKTDSEEQKSKMAEDLVQDSNDDLSKDCNEPTEVHHPTDISNTLAHSEEDLDSDPLLTQSENPFEIYAQEDFGIPAGEQPQSEPEDRIQPPNSSKDLKVEILQENDLDFKGRDLDEDVTEQVSERDYEAHNQVGKPVNEELSESNNGEEANTVRARDLEMHEEAYVEDTDDSIVQNHVSCCEIVDASMLEISESEQTQGKELAGAELFGRHMADPKSGPTDSCTKDGSINDEKDNNVAKSDLNIREEVTEVHDMQKQEERSQEMHRTALEIVPESVNNQRKERTEKASFEQYRKNKKKDKVSCIKDVEVITSDLEMYEGVAQISKDLEGQVESSQVEGATCLKEEKETLKVDIFVATSELEKEAETQNVLQEQFGCQDKGCVNEEGLFAEDKVEEKLINVGVHENLCTEPNGVGSLPEDVEQNQDKGIRGKVNKELNEKQLEEVFHDVSCMDVKDIDVPGTELEMREGAVAEDNKEYGQDDMTCVKETITAVEKIQKQDILEKMPGKSALNVTENFDVQQKVEYGQKEEEACVKEASILELASKLAKETEKRQGKLVLTTELGKINALECQEEGDLQNLEPEMDQNKMFINKDKLSANAKDVDENEKSEFASLSTKSKGIAPQVYSLTQIYSKDVTDSSLVCLPISNVNNSAAILERSSSIPTCETSTNATDISENTNCEQEEKCPKSLWDAVNRIRRHTAPDSENEEEEITDNWDRESVAPDYVVSVENRGHFWDEALQEAAKEEGLKLYTAYEDLNMQDDILSQCSNSSSEESEGTIVDEEFEAEMTNVRSPSSSKEDHCSDGGKDENGDKLNQNQTDVHSREKLANAKEMLEKL